MFWIFLASKTLALIGKILTEMQRFAIIIAVVKPQLGVIHKCKLNGTIDDLLLLLEQPIYTVARSQSSNNLSLSFHS